MESVQPKHRRRVVWTVLAILAVVGALSGLVDEAGQRDAGEAFTQALVTFAMVRTLNGVISVAQGTEVAIEPAGVGVNFTVGQILDPINDLVERFSAIMLVATSSLGLQNVLLRITGSWGVTLGLVVVLGVAVAALWIPKFKWISNSLAIRAMLVAICIRFAVPVFVICTNLVSDVFLVDEQMAAVEALDSTRVEIEEFNEEAAQTNAEDESIFDQIGSALSSSIDAINFERRIEALRDRVSGASEHVVNLIVIFALQTILLPLAFLWLFVGALKSLAGRAGGRHGS